MALPQVNSASTVVFIPNEGSLLDSVMNSRAFQGTKIMASWALTGCVRFPWQVIAAPYKAVNAIPFFPFKPVVGQIVSSVWAYFLYQQVRDVPVVGPVIHTVVPIACTSIVSVASALGSFLVKETANAVVGIAANALEELKENLFKKLSYGSV